MSYRVGTAASDGRSWQVALMGELDSHCPLGDADIEGLGMVDEERIVVLACMEVLYLMPVMGVLKRTVVGWIEVTIEEVRLMDVIIEIVGRIKAIDEIEVVSGRGPRVGTVLTTYSSPLIR